MSCSACRKTLPDLQDCSERALFLLEKCFKFSFVSQACIGKCRLPYAVYDNRAFHLVLFRQIHFAKRKGAWKSAFEMAKFLFFLDSDQDPMGILHLVDFLALRCA